MDENKPIFLRYKSAGGTKLIKINPKQDVPKAMQTGYIGVPGAVNVNFPAFPAMSANERKISELIYNPADDIAIPNIERKKPDDVESADRTSFKYPLIPQNPKTGERVFSYTNIILDPRTKEFVYNVIEPEIDEKTEKILEEIKEYIEEKIDINFAQVRKKDAIDYLEKIFDNAIKYFKIKANADILKYYVMRDFMGLDKIEPFMQDKLIEDISCDGVGIPIYVYHRDPRIGSVKTNIMFKTRDELDSFVNKLSERCGKNISVAKPLLDGTLPDGSRVQSTLESDIARHGSNFTIRMFTEDPLTPPDLIKFGTCDMKTMAYLWFVVEHGFSILISGGTATGKTSLLNVLSLFIKPQMKIVSIEDTAELRLPHSHWIPEVARTPISEEGKVDMFELLRESLRQRPDYIIVGEVRGREAYVLFQQMAVGHSGLSTIHAENFSKLIDRLTSPPISLPANLIENLDLIIFVKRVRRGNRYQRRVNSIIEIVGYDLDNKVPIINKVIDWNPKDDKFVIKNKSYLLKKISDLTGMDKRAIAKDIENRVNILDWICKRKIKDYRTVSSIINMYYTSPDFLLGKIEGEL
jgi:flagellar protein FlaI